MTVFEHARPAADRRLRRAVPRDEQPGVDLILPDFGYIRDRLDDIEAVVLTHAHEDHIGAVPFLLRERPDLPMVGSRLTLALLASKLAEHRMKPDTLEVIEEGGRTASGRSTASSSPSTTRSLTRSPSPSARRPAPCCTPATSRWTSCRSTAGSPTSAASPGSGARASTCCCRTRPTPRCPASSRREREIGAGARRRVPHGRAAGHRRLLRQPRPPGAAGARRRRSPRAHGRLRRPLDGAQHGRRPRPRAAARPARPDHRRPRDRRAARQARLHDLDRFAGRAAVGAVAHGQPRPPGAHRVRRHHRPGVAA